MQVGFNIVEALEWKFTVPLIREARVIYKSTSTFGAQGVSVNTSMAAARCHSISCREIEGETST